MGGVGGMGGLSKSGDSSPNATDLQQHLSPLQTPDFTNPPIPPIPPTVKKTRFHSLNHYKVL